MKNHSLFKITGVLFLLIAIACTCFTHSSGKTSKHPPGICSIVYHPDLQKANDATIDYLHWAVLCDPNWEPKTTFVGVILTRSGKAIPKTARQRLYGEQDVKYYNKIC